MQSYRYLMNIAYMGHLFRGAQRQIIKSAGPPYEDPSTVQGRIDMALKGLKSVNVPMTVLSSRTDLGVHAMNSTVHVDLIRYSEKPYIPQVMTLELNKYFKRNHLPIRILKTSIVPSSFHCRKNAISRTYLYRMMLIKGMNDSPFGPLSVFVPIEEWDRCACFCVNDTNFDLNIMRECAKLFEGYHDFRTFMKKSDTYYSKDTKRTIEYIKICHKPFTKVYSSYSWPSIVLDENLQYTSIDIYIKSKGFLYHQVRRTVAALAAVAQGKVTLKDIKFMLEVPSYRSWSKIKTFPAHGLYLCEVEYSKEDLAAFKTILEV